MFMAMGAERAIETATALKAEGVEVYFIMAAGEEYEVFSTLEQR